MVPLVIAWLFIAFSGVELLALVLDRIDDRPPYSLPGVDAVAPAWGVAADDDT
jgi:hypothetical protein